METQKKSVTLEPREHEKVSFSFSPTRAGLYNISVDGLSGKLEVLVPPPELSLKLELKAATESPSPGTIYAGGGMNIHGIVTNVGNYQGVYHMKWYVNGELIYSCSHVINAGNTHNNSHRYAAMDIGAYDIKVTVDSKEAVGNFSAIEAPPGEPNVSLWFKALAPIIYPGQSPMLEIRPHNRGNAIANYSYILCLDGVEVDSNTGTLGIGELKRMSWNGAIDTVGVHELHIVMEWDGHAIEKTQRVTVKERPTGTGLVWGCVYDRHTRQPIPEAVLTISGMGVIDLNVEGCYELTLNAGRWDFRCEASGYLTMLWPITVRVNERIKRSFVMTPL